MAYKKYIKRGGKIYGPYIYHSKRIDGKVISEYRGSEKLNYKKIFLVIFGGIFLAALIFILIFSGREITGNAVLNLDADYQQGEALEGKLKLSLQEGELIPVSSKLIFNNNGKVFEYELKELVSDELSEGNFYVEGTPLSGFGEGYGISGKKGMYPEIHFILNILSEKESSGEQVNGLEQIKNTTQEQIETLETEENETKETFETEENETKEILETEEQIQEAPIPENIISVVSNFFLGLTMTGNAVVEFEREVNGVVSSNENFIYILQKGERVELKPRSVKTDSEQLSDSDIELRIEDNQVIVTTNYSELEIGFGREYIGDKSKDLIIDISKLDLILEQGTLEVSIIDSDQEIISLSTVLEQSKEGENKIVSESVLQTPEQNLITGINDEKEEKEIYVPKLVVSLTEQERSILLEKFGDNLKVKEVLLKNGFINIRYEFSSKYWVEFNYDANLSSEIIELFKDRDMTKWLKDIAKKLSEELEPEKEFNEYSKSFLS